MHAGRVGNFAHDRVLLQVDHDDFGRVRQVETTRGGIDIQDVPTAFAPNWNLGEQFVGVGGGSALTRRTTHAQMTRRKYFRIRTPTAENGFCTRCSAENAVV